MQYITNIFTCRWEHCNEQDANMFCVTNKQTKPSVPCPGAQGLHYAPQRVAFQRSPLLRVSPVGSSVTTSESVTLFDVVWCMMLCDVSVLSSGIEQASDEDHMKYYLATTKLDHQLTLPCRGRMEASFEFWTFEFFSWLPKCPCTICSSAPQVS